MFTERVQTRATSKEDTRAAVLLAASQLFTTEGPQVAVRRIADTAGVSVGTVMGIADKDGLIVLTVDATIARLGEMPALSAPDQVAAVLRELRPFVEWFGAHLELARAYLSILVSGAHRSSVFDALAAQLTVRIESILDDRPDAGSTARLIHRLYLGELMIWAGSGTTDPARTLAELERSIRATLRSEP